MFIGLAGHLLISAYRGLPVVCVFEHYKICIAWLFHLANDFIIVVVFVQKNHGSQFSLFDMEGFGGDTTHGC